jgi:prevent-host-death family protein
MRPIMITVGTYEAKTHLPQLIEKVEGGESVMITRHGKPVARIVPVTGTGEAGQRSSQEIVADFRKLRQSVRPARAGGPSNRDLINEGRKR